MDGEMEENAPAPQQPQQQPPEHDNGSVTPAVSVSRVNVIPNQSGSSGNNTNTNPPLLPRVVNVEVDEDVGNDQGGGRRENTRLRRKWEYFPGKNRFYCDGRVITAPSIRFCVLSFALILLTFTLFIVFDAPFLTERLTVAIPIVGSILFVSVIVNMVKTSFSDPGILPRATQQEAEHLEKSYYSANFRPPPRTKDIVVNGQLIKSKYCFTCKMFRPPRASHCGVCDNCVDRFDHHCPFLGNCIGKRNYRSFYTFIVSLSFLAVFVLSASIAHLAMVSKEKGNFLMALQETPSSAVVVLISFFGMWTVIGLTGFHTYLIAVEQTTNEDIKGLFGRANAKNPFSHGNFCQNCCYVLCGPSQPSLLDPRGFATPEFIASIPRKTDPNGIVSSGKIPQLNAAKSSSNNCANEQQNHGLGQNSLAGGTNQIYHEQIPTARTVQPVHHLSSQLSSSSSSSPPQQPQSNGNVVNPAPGNKPQFPLLPAIPPEEKILLKGQSRNGRATDYRQTVPESISPEEIQMSQQEALISPSAASTVSLSTVSTSNMSSSNDYDSVHSPLGTASSKANSTSNYRPHYQQRSVRKGSTNGNGNVLSTKRLFHPSSSASADHLDGLVDPSDFDDDLDMPSLSNVNEIDAVSRRRSNNSKSLSNARNNNSSNGLTKSTRSLPSTAGIGGAGSEGDINKIHVLESYPNSSKSVNSKATVSSSGSRKFGNTSLSGNNGRVKRSLESTMQNSPLHLDTIM